MSPRMRPRDHPAAAFAVAAACACAWLQTVPARHPSETDDGFALRQAQEALVLFTEVFRHGLEAATWSFEGRAPFEAVGHGELEPESGSHLPQAAARSRALPFQYYHDVYAGYRVDLDAASGLGDLCDDALDIWRDLRGPLDLWDAGHHDAAAWYWQLRFGQHTGAHLVHAMQALHDFVTTGPQAP